MLILSWWQMKETELELGEADKAESRWSLGKTGTRDLGVVRAHSCSSLLVLASLSITFEHLLRLGLLLLLVPNLAYLHFQDWRGKATSHLPGLKKQSKILIGLTWSHVYSWANPSDRTETL